MSSPVSRAAILLEALQTATTTPMIRAASELEEDRVVAEWTASANTPEAPGGRALARPLTSRFTVVAPTWTSLIRPRVRGGRASGPSRAARRARRGRGKQQLRAGGRASR